MKSFLVRYGVWGYYATSRDDPKQLWFTDIVYTREDWPSLDEIFQRAKTMHHPGYKLFHLTHVREVKLCGATS